MGTTASILSTMGNATSGFVVQQAQAGAITRQANFSSRLAELDAQDAITRGDQAANVRGLQGRRMIGSQRAIQGASGIDPNSGSAAQVQGDEAFLSALDQATIQNNAAREAWGYRTNASLDALGAKNTAANLKAQSYSTLLTGAAQSYGLYKSSRNTTTSQPMPPAPRGGYNVFGK